MKSSLFNSGAQNLQNLQLSNIGTECQIFVEYTHTQRIFGEYSPLRFAQENFVESMWIKLTPFVKA